MDDRRHQRELGSGEDEAVGVAPRRSDSSGVDPGQVPAGSPSLGLVLLLLVGASLLSIAAVLVGSEIIREDRRNAAPSPPPVAGIQQADALPDNGWLNFLAELCPDECFRDAHWMDPSDLTRGAGGWVAGRPFHVREGFLALGVVGHPAAYDVRLLITRRDGPDVGNAAYPLGRTIVDATDHVVLGSTESCGPTYASQDGLQQCVWFVHDFPAGLPPGRYDIRAEWHAPCSAWLELGFTDRCADADAIVTMFDSFVNAEFAAVGSEDPMQGLEPVSIGRAGIDQTSEGR